MSAFGSGRCGICGKRIRWDDEFCSDLCEAEADRRGEETTDRRNVMENPYAEDTPDEADLDQAEINANRALIEEEQQS
jgi:hypothetical protein